VFRETLKCVHHKFANFNHLQKIDLSEQLIGDDGVDKLCMSIFGSPVQQLNLSGNKITDQGLERLSYVLRSLSALKSLNLSWNEFTDVGIPHITHAERYAPFLRELDLSYNVIDVDSAYHLAYLFSVNITGTVQVLRLGGNVGTIKHWGDAFLQVFTTILLNNNIDQLRELHIPDFHLTDIGIEVVLSLLCSDKVKLDVLNMSKNFIRKESTRMLLLSAVQVCRQSVDFRAVDCGFSQQRLLSFQQRLQSSKHTLRWLPNAVHLLLAQRVMKSIYDSRMMYVKMQKVMLNSRKIDNPMHWKFLSLNFDNDLMSNINSMLSKSANFLNRVVRYDLVALNNEIAYVHKLQELIASAKNKEIPKSANQINQGSPVTDRLQLRILSNQNDIYRAEVEARRRFPLWNNAIDQLLTVCGEVMAEVRQKLLNRRHRNAQTVTPTQTEWIQMAIEDCLAHTIEKALQDQQLIGLYCEQKLLRFSEVQRSVRSKVEVKEFEEYLYTSIPCCVTLQLPSYFVFYSFLQFPKDQEGHAVVDVAQLEVIHQQAPGAAADGGNRSSLARIERRRTRSPSVQVPPPSDLEGCRKDRMRVGLIALNCDNNPPLQPKSLWDTVILLNIYNILQSVLFLF
jgi:hypothetical protein